MTTATARRKQTRSALNAQARAGWMRAKATPPLADRRPDLPHRQVMDPPLLNEEART